MNRLVMIATLVISCSEPVCGCSPRIAGLDVEAVLRTAAGAPRGGMRVRTEVAAQPCATYYPAHDGIVSAPDGRLRYTIWSTPPDSVCLRFFATDTALGSPMIALPGIVRANVTYDAPFQLVTADLVLPP